MIIANVKPGLYYIIEDDVVIGKVHRMYASGMGEYFDVTYQLRWKDDRPNEDFKTLYQIEKVYHFDNYPGYNAILKKRH